MSDRLDNAEPTQATPEAQSTTQAKAETPATPAVEAAPADKLDDIENIDFLLEEIENKIAPLALA